MSFDELRFDCFLEPGRATVLLGQSYMYIETQTVPLNAPNAPASPPAV